MKALAKAKEVPSINSQTGEASTRPALPSDHWPDPFPNETAARAANNNALPPDLSLIIKARPNGQRYVYSLLTGYGKEPPKGFDVPQGRILGLLGVGVAAARERSVLTHLRVLPL